MHICGDLPLNILEMVPHRQIHKEWSKFFLFVPVTIKDLLFLLCLKRCVQYVIFETHA